MRKSNDIPRWGDKPYRSLDWELRRRFGCKVYKLSLDGGCTCPNRDGSIGLGGCIFCSEGGSGDFAGNRHMDITTQIEQQKTFSKKHADAGQFIAYFQAYTNTYAPVSYLRSIFMPAISRDDICALSIATRPDCLPDDVLALLEELSAIKPVWVELGLQTIHEETAQKIRRGYELPVFEKAVRALRSRGIDVIVHVILGLPGESSADMLQTIDYLSRMDIQGIKLQLLHVLRHTDLGRSYEKDPFPVLTREEYIHLVAECLEHLSPDITVHRLTGDGPRNLLIAPQWSTRKRSVLNALHSYLRETGSYQGRSFLKPER